LPLLFVIDANELGTVATETGVADGSDVRDAGDKIAETVADDDNDKAVAAAAPPVAVAVAADDDCDNCMGCGNDDNDNDNGDNVNDANRIYAAARDD
jgi:hypothetical protein